MNLTKVAAASRRRNKALVTEQAELGRLCHFPAPSGFMAAIRTQDLETAPTPEQLGMTRVTDDRLGAPR